MKNNLKNILLVEDDLNFGSVLNDFLNLHSYNVVLAKNGIEGLEKFKKNEFGLCILDVMLPFKDGFTLAREIREINKDVPLFFLTAKTLKDDVLKGYKLGILDFGKMARLIENEAINGAKAYTLSEMMSDLKKGIWEELYTNKPIDVYRRNLQLAYIDRINYIMNEEQGSTPSWARSYVTTVKVSQSDIRTVSVGQLLELKKEIKKSLKKNSDEMSKIHLMTVEAKINRILIGKPI